MNQITLTWTIGMSNGEVVENGRRFSRLHRELDRWHQDHELKERIFKLIMPRAFTYETTVDRDDPRIQLFMSTWQGMDYRLTTVTEQE